MILESIIWGFLGGMTGASIFLLVLCFFLKKMKKKMDAKMVMEIRMNKKC